MSMNSAANGHQTIHCNVGSCEYNAQNRHCNLGSIQVSAQEKGSTGKACDESMCGSYRSK